MADQIVSLRITADARGMIAGVQLAKSQTDSLGSAGEQAGRKISGSMGGATDIIRRFAAAAGAALSARAYVQLADQYANISARLRLVTQDQARYAAALDQSYAIAQRTSTGLESTAELYGRMQRAADGLGRSQADALRVTELINKTFQVSGTAAATANASIIQLAQGLGAGALRGDEFNSVLEGSPRLAQALADSLGVTTGGLRAMAEAGELTADKIITALLEQGDAIDAEFGQLPLTFGRAWTQIENAALVAIGKIEQQVGASGALAQGLQGLVGFIEKIPESVAIWRDAFGRAASDFDVLVGPFKDVIGSIADEFLILPVSVRTVVTVIIGEFDQLRISAVEQFQLLVNGAKGAWGGLESSAAAVAGQMRIVFARAIDSIIKSFAGMVSTLSKGATNLGADGIGAELSQMAQTLRANAGLEEEVSRAVSKAARAYEVKAQAVLEAREGITESANAARSASQAAVQAALDEREAALRQINTKKELATASTATGAAIVRANEKAADSSKEAKKALEEQSKAMQYLEDMAAGYARELAGPIDQAWMDYEEAVRDATAAAEAAAEASDKLGAAGASEAAIQARLEAAIDGAAQARDRSISAAERAADVTGEILRDLEIEARLAGMTAEQRRVEEIVLRAVAAAREEANRQQKESIALDSAEQESLRQLVAQKLADIGASQRAAEEAQRAAEESARAWEDFAYGMADAVLDGSDGVKRYWKRLIDDLKRELIASGLMTLFRSIFNIGGGGSGAGSLLGAMFGGGGGGSGLFGNLLGGGGNNAGALGSMLFGGGSGITGLMNLFRGGTISSSMGIQQVNAITGAQGASGGAGSILGGGMLQNGFSMGGMMGAGGGIMMGLQGIRTGNALQGAAGGAMAGMSIGGPWGALIGGIIGGLGALIRGNKPPDFRVGGTQASVRNPEGGFETVFGRVRAGSREISWESLVQPMQQFDQAIADMVQSFGMGQQQMDSIRDALARWSVDLKGDAATAEGVLGSRFGAILSTFSQDVQTFVGNTGTVQERVGRLADALAIEDIVDVGALGDSFADVSALLGEYRQGTEAITDTYARVLGSVTLLDQALALSGTTLDMTRGELIRFAADITDAAGGLERAQQLWGGYYATFYTETERAQVQLAQATERASALFAAANLDLAQYTGDGGAAAFRDMFERLLPTLSAEAVVQYLEMAEALGIVIDLTGQASGNVSEFAGTLADLMADVTGQLAEFAPQQSWAQQLAAITTETEALIARATKLGATEEQLAQIRELGAARVGDVLAQQADAYRQYADLVRGLSDEAADLRGLTEYQREMREIDRWTRNTADALNAAARAAGMQAAAEEDLALMHEVAAARAAAAMARLAQRGRDIVAQLAGSRLTQIDQQMGEVGTAVGTWMSQAAGGMDQVTQATDNAVQALIGAQQRVRDWLNGIMSSEASGLRPKDRLTEVLALAERTRVAAAGGDAEAMARMPQLADEILRLGRDVYASGAQYFELRDMVRGWMQGLADIVIPTPEPGTGGGSGAGGGGGGGLGGGIVDGTLEQQQQASAQAAAERRALWMELVAVIRDMMSAPDQTLQGIEETLGFSMRDLVTELGVSLTDMTVATAGQLAGIAQAMGVELTDLASHVGVSLGSLGDRQSLLNDALESTIATLPSGQRDLLEPLLRDVEEAAALGDTAGVEAGISDMEDAIAEMAPDIRDLLAPYFNRIAPADPATELSHLATMETTLGSSLSELQAQTLSLAAIEGLLTGGGGLPTSGGQIIPVPGLGGGAGVPPPGYAVGTSYVPSDGLAYLHRGEMVWPAAVSDFFRREGIPISAPPRAFATRSNDAGDPAVTGLLRDIVVAARESQAELRALRERVAQLESTIAAGDDRKIRAMDRQTDQMRGR